MQLALAIVQTCTRTGCRVRLLGTERDLETRYSTQILRFEVEVRPGDLVVVDVTPEGAASPPRLLQSRHSERSVAESKNLSGVQEDPSMASKGGTHSAQGDRCGLSRDFAAALASPRTVFCFARTQVERVQTQVRTDRHPRDLSPIEGLDAPLQPGDWVFADRGRVYDLCVHGLPSNPERLWAEAGPMVESIVQPGAPEPEPEPPPARTAGPPQVEYLTAETERGRQALRTVMDRSYDADYEGLPPAWTLVRLVDGVPVSYIVVVPDLELDMGVDSKRVGGVRYAFVNDVATRTDRRREGHFRALMEHTYERLRRDGYSLILLHGRYPLYRPLGFDVFTHHSGILITPEQIERALGTGQDVRDRDRLRYEAHRGIQPDLLVVSEVQAGTPSECAAALRAAAALAREKGRERILFEHPSAPCGKRYQAHASPETPLTALARTCGAEVRLQGADPEGGAIPDADWIKVLDAAAFLEQVFACRPDAASSSPPCSVRGGLRGGSLALDTDAGAVTITVRDGRATARPGLAPGAPVLPWPSSALAQLATGYRSAETLALLHDLALPPEAQALLSDLFPTCWRFSRNESWTLNP